MVKCAGCETEIPEEYLKGVEIKNNQKVFCCEQCAVFRRDNIIILDGCY